MRSIELVKLVFLLAHEAKFVPGVRFYDFIPYKFGPHSFLLYYELSALRKFGYIESGTQLFSIDQRNEHLVREKVQELPSTIRESTHNLIERYANSSVRDLVADVYDRYPWYTINSELANLLPSARPAVPVVEPKVYTVGYEKRSVDLLFDQLLKAGIRHVVDVRANAVSRSWGFSGSAVEEIGRRLGLDYTHMSELGISSADRRGISDESSRGKLLDEYSESLSERRAEVASVGHTMLQQPTALLCLEADAQRCHRSRLAAAVSGIIELPIVHL